MAKNTIKLRKFNDVVDEYTANAALYPGMLIELMSTGKVRKHATASGNVYPMFALEDEMQGGTIDTVYAASSVVQCWIPGRGDIVNALIPDGQNIAVGDRLVSNGDGYLTKYTASDDSTMVQHPTQIVGIAMEAVDLSGSSGEEEAGGIGDFSHRIAVMVQ